MSRPQLEYLPIEGLIADAGGDPWAIDDSLQAGRPAQINFLAEAFHSAGRCTTEAQNTFQTAEQHFQDYHRDTGEKPINDSPEVQRVKHDMHASDQQLGQIAADLASLAADLAQAQQSSRGAIEALNADLQNYDNDIADYVWLEETSELDEQTLNDIESDIQACYDDAVADTTTTLHAVTGVRGDYSQQLQQALTHLRVDDGYDPDVAVRGLDAQTVPDDPGSQRSHNQEQAFKDVYGREPVSVNDWRMAAALDPHSYDPKYHGVPPQIVAGKFTPQPGKGIVRSNMFIPAGWVWNTFKNIPDLEDGRILPKNFGDNRGPSATADPEASRVSLYVDYDHGIVVVRQNPTVNVDGQRGVAAAAVPNVHVVQGPGGRMTIDYNANDAYENPLGTAAGITVNGRITLSPQSDGTVALGGNTTIYPSMETYQYRDGLPVAQLQWSPANSGGPWGPAGSLPRHHWVGDATLVPVRPKMPAWLWELENADPFEGDPFLTHTTRLTNPFQGGIPSVVDGN